MNEPLSATSRAWSWRHAVAKSGLPPLTRFVLHTLGLYMDSTGGSCFPSVADLVSDTGLDKKTVLKHLETAKERGWINVSKHGYAGQRWKRNEYSARWPGRDLVGTSLVAHDEGGGTVPPPSASVKVVEMGGQGGGNDVQKVVEHVHQDKNIPVNIPPTSQSGVGAGPVSKDDFESEDGASIERRVRLLEFGKTGSPQWPNAGLRSNKTAVREFRKLSPDEQLLAEERRDLYLDLCKQQSMTPLWLSSYLGEKKFLDIQPVAASADAPVHGKIPVAPFGRIWGGLRALALLAGPEAVDVPLDPRESVVRTFEHLRSSGEGRGLSYLQRKGITLSSGGDLIFPDYFEQEEARRLVRESGYPEVNRLHEQARSHKVTSAEARFAILADLVEPVPVGDDLFKAWKDHDEAVNWPFVPETGRQPVVYFPKGGPQGLGVFEQSVKAAFGRERSNEHAA